MQIPSYMSSWSKHYMLDALFPASFLSCLSCVFVASAGSAARVYMVAWLHAQLCKLPVSSSHNNAFSAKHQKTDACIVHDKAHNSFCATCDPGTATGAQMSLCSVCLAQCTIFIHQLLPDAARGPTLPQECVNVLLQATRALVITINNFAGEGLGPMTCAHLRLTDVTATDETQHKSMGWFRFPSPAGAHKDRFTVVMAKLYKASVPRPAAWSCPSCYRPCLCHWFGSQQTVLHTTTCCCLDMQPCCLVCLPNSTVRKGLSADSPQTSVSLQPLCGRVCVYVLFGWYRRAR